MRHHTYLPALLLALLLSVLSVLPSSVCFSGEMVETMHCTIVASPTGSVRYVGHYVGRIHWIDCRNISPAASTVTVYRIYSEGPGTDTVASVVCTAGLGRAAPNTNTWYALLGEYFAISGCDTGTVRIITSGVP
jgi:hypothetical protein